MLTNDTLLKSVTSVIKLLVFLKIILDDGKVIQNVNVCMHN